MSVPLVVRKKNLTSRQFLNILGLLNFCINVQYLSKLIKK